MSRERKSEREERVTEKLSLRIFGKKKNFQFVLHRMFAACARSRVFRLSLKLTIRFFGGISMNEASVPHTFTRMLLSSSISLRYS